MRGKAGVLGGEPTTRRLCDNTPRVRAVNCLGSIAANKKADRALSRILHQRGMPRLTPKTITTPAALRVQLEQVRAAGYALDDEEHAVGLRCIAAPIFDETGETIAAISASGPMARIVEERVAPLGALVLETARAISHEMGATPDRGRKSTGSVHL